MIFGKKGSDPFAKPLALIALALMTPHAHASDCATDLLNAQRDQSWIYKVSYQGMGTEATRRLELGAAGSWSLSQSMSLLIVSLNEKSSMLLSGGALSTLEYLKEQKGLGARTTQISVNQSAMQVNTLYKGQAQSYTISSPVLDPLSHSLQMQIDRQCLGKSSTLEYPLVGRSGLKAYRYEALGEESISTPWGALVAERWQRQEGETRDTLWLVPQKQFALVRVEHEERGELSSLMLSRVE